MGFFPFMTSPRFAQCCLRAVEMPEDKTVVLHCGCCFRRIFPRSWVSLPASCGYSSYAGVPEILQVTHFGAVESESRSCLPINGSFDNSWKAVRAISRAGNSAMFQSVTSPLFSTWLGLKGLQKPLVQGPKARLMVLLKENPSKKELDGLKLGVTTL